jgi:squalene-associated FAD-dependent desaturase
MKIVVVGGGIAGLSAATRLVGDHEVTLFEKRALLGGRAWSTVDETTGDVIDNGQHVVLGCCRALRRFLERIGARERLTFQRALDVTFVDGGRRDRLKAAPLPAPLHLLGGLIGFHALGARDRLNLLKVAAGIAHPTALFPAASDYETVDRWLDRVGQSTAARRGFWHPLTRAVLNDDPATASAKMLEAVLREAFFGSRDDARLGLFSVGLSELYADDAARFVEARGGRVVTAAPVERLRIEDRTVRGVVLRDGSRHDADAVIAAVPPAVLLELVPAELRTGETFFEGLERLRPSPIVSVHLWFDRRVCEAELYGLVDRPIHFIFNRNRLSTVRTPDESYLSCVVSAAHDLVERAPDEIIRIAVDEVRRALPGAAHAALRHARVLKEREATIAHPAGSESFRPSVRTPIAGLFVAGDHVRTGLPATLESAVRAADEAVERIAAWVPPPRRVTPTGTTGTTIPAHALVRGGAPSPAETR